MSTQKFEVWSEGYWATGMIKKSDPVYHGECRGNSFADACRNLLDGNRYFNSKNLTYWSCKLYSTRFEAFNFTPEEKGELQ